MSTERRVVITGIGSLASPGISKDAFWEGILNKKFEYNFEVNRKVKYYFLYFLRLYREFAHYKRAVI